MTETAETIVGRLPIENGLAQAPEARWKRKWGKFARMR